MSATTDWFDCFEYKPVRDGFYEVEFREHNRVIAIGKVEWHDDRWGYFASMRPSGAMNDRWRGLTSQPDTEKKS